MPKVFAVVQGTAFGLGPGSASLCGGDAVWRSLRRIQRSGGNLNRRTGNFGGSGATCAHFLPNCGQVPGTGQAGHAGSAAAADRCSGGVDVKSNRAVALALAVFSFASGRGGAGQGGVLSCDVSGGFGWIIGWSRP